MLTHKELLIRQSILTEFHSGSSRHQALLNITTKFGGNSVSKSKIKRWYRQFESHDMSLFDKGTSQHNIVSVIQTVGNRDEMCIIDSIVFKHQNESTYGISDNGRFLIFANFYSENHIKITLFNVIRGEKQEIRFTSQSNYGFIVEAHILSNQHLLMKTSHGWIVLKIDFESQQVSKISALVYNNLSGRNSKVIIDQLNKQNLLIRGLGLFATGSLIDDTIVFNPRRQFNEWLTYPKLAGNYLYGFHPLDDETNVPNWEYCTFDLTTSTKEAINVSFILDDGCHIQIWEHSVYSWAGTRLYGVSRGSDYQRSIFAFDSETLKFSRIGITVYGYIRKIIVDENHFLTLEATKFPHEKKRSIYRLALRKPESMKNLAWFNIRRYAILFDGKDYEIVRNRFPMLMP